MFAAAWCDHISTPLTTQGDVHGGGVPSGATAELEAVLARGEIYKTRLEIRHPRLRDWMSLKAGQEAHHDVVVTLSQV